MRAGRLLSDDIDMSRIHPIIHTPPLYLDLTCHDIDMSRIPHHTYTPPVSRPYMSRDP